jgi:hypothetical protein
MEIPCQGTAGFFEEPLAARLYSTKPKDIKDLPQALQEMSLPSIFHLINLLL